jgi:hypothetical protein
MRRTSRRLYFGGSLSITLIGQAAPQTAVGWPDTIDLLKHERSQADECVSLLKDAGGKSAIDRGRAVYGDAKAASDGAIAGLEVALVQGYKPEGLKGIHADLDAAGAGLQEVCDAAKQAAAEASGTKGVVSDAVKAAVEPVIAAIKDGISGLWNEHLKQEQAEIDSIKGQLQAAKWREF